MILFLIHCRPSNITLSLNNGKGDIKDPILALPQSLLDQGPIMKALIVLPLFLALAKANRVCDGTCVQGEGDCDRDSDCLPGLKCEFDWWFGTDHCHAGEMRMHYFS